MKLFRKLKCIKTCCIAVVSVSCNCSLSSNSKLKINKNNIKLFNKEFPKLILLLF